MRSGAMRSKLFVALASVSLAVAMPSAHREPMDELAVRHILDELESRGEDVESLIKRVDPKVYRDVIPACETEDPSFMIPKDTGYSVDQGIKLPRVGNNDACTTGHNSDHCWTEYWFVESAIEYSSWQNSGAAVDCASTSSCNSMVAELNQSCTSYSHDTWDAFSVTLDGTLDLAVISTAPNVHLGASLGYSHTEVNGQGTQRCTTYSTTNTCIWSDQACHQVWYADRTKRIWGHMDRVCVGRTDSDVQQQTVNAAGNIVRGQAEFSIAIPVNQIVGCNALCTDQTYNEPLPNDGDQRVPFDITWIS